MRRLILLLGVLAVSVTVAVAQEDVIVIDKLPFVCDKPATYTLAGDLSCNDSGIHIRSNDVVIDLDGHTLTFGTGVKINEKAKTYNSLQSGNVGHHAIYVTGDPRASKDATKAGWNYRFTGVVIRNGGIRHGSGKGLAYSDAINVSGTVGCEIRDLVIELSAPDTGAIVGGRQSKIHHCNITHTGTHVTNRHQGLAVIVSGSEAEVFDCTLLGGPQLGVKASSGSHIHHNDIRHNATVTNCYGIAGYGQKGVRAHHNRIIATNGRGLHVSEKSVGWRVHHNYIEARERANREYPKGLDTHGIKLEGCRDAEVYLNVVVCESSQRGNPTPLNLSVKAGSNNVVRHNAFIARKITPKERATAIFLVGGDGTGTEIFGNTFVSNDRMLEVYWHPGNNFTFRDCRFYRLTPGDEITTVYFWNTKPASNIRLIDCIFGPGVSRKKQHFPVKTPEKWPADARYTVAWTAMVTVTNARRPARDTQLTFTDAAGNVAAKLATDNEGKARTELKEFTMHFDGTTRQVRAGVFAPYTLNIKAAGKSQNMVLAMTDTAVVNVDIATGAHTVGVPKGRQAQEMRTKDFPLDRLIAEAKRQASPRK